jgi:hypothetical protein
MLPWPGVPVHHVLSPTGERCRCAPMSDALKKLRWQWILLPLGLWICGFAFVLQQVGVPSLAASSGGVLVTLYVRNSDARLLLRSFVFPNDPAQDYLTFSVTTKAGLDDPWLLVIQCPTRIRFKPRHQVPLYLENASASPVGQRVLAFSQPRGVRKKNRHIPLGCFTRPSTQQKGSALSGIAAEQASSVSTLCGAAWIRFGCAVAIPALQASGIATGQVINVTLPTLEGDPAAQLTNVSTPVYAEETARGTIKDLVEVYQAPGVICPTPLPTPPPSPAQAHSAAQGENAADSSPTISPPSPSPSPSSGPSPSSSPGPENGCYRPISKHTNPVIYHIPLSVETTETLENTNLSGDRVDSMFPPGQIRSNDQVYWQGISGLSPSFNATNLAAEARDSEYSFFAGVLYGLGLGVIFAFVQVMLGAASERREDRSA